MGIPIVCPSMLLNLWNDIYLFVKPPPNSALGGFWIGPRAKNRKNEKTKKRDNEKTRTPENKKNDKNMKMCHVFLSFFRLLVLYFSVFRFFRFFSPFFRLFILAFGQFIVFSFFSFFRFFVFWFFRFFVSSSGSQSKNHTKKDFGKDYDLFKRCAQVMTPNSTWGPTRRAQVVPSNSTRGINNVPK